MFLTCSELGIFMYWTCNSMSNLLSYYGLVDARWSASEKDLPLLTWKHLTLKRVSKQSFIFLFLFRYQSGENITFVSPGHGSVVKSRKGEDWYIYHAWLYDKINDRNPGRVLMLDKITWNSGTIHKFRQTNWIFFHKSLYFLTFYGNFVIHK